MQNFQKRLDEIVDKISYLESRRIKIGKILREINDSFKIGPNEEVLDEKIINSVPGRTFEKINVLGVDGGIVKHSYHGLDLMLLRSVGVIFRYSDGKLNKVEYHPSSNPTPNPKIILDSFSDVELNSCYNFERQIMEVTSAIKAIKELKPNIALLDGSIIPHYVPRPDNPILKEYYDKLIATYKSLFELSEKKKIILAGVIEDSRGVKFCDILIRRVLTKVESDVLRELKLILERTKDTNLLYYALERGERTCVFNYSENPKIHPVLKEFEDMGNAFRTFYIKTVDFDRPLRVDFLSFGDETNVVEILSSLLLESSGHSSYGLPAVLIEADQRAKLSEKDLDMFYSDLINRVGNVSTLFKMRREMRPF